MARKFSKNRNLSAAPMTVACEVIGVHENTLRAWAKAGKIKHFRTVGGQYRYDVGKGRWSRDSAVKGSESAEQ